MNSADASFTCLVDVSVNTLIPHMVSWPIAGDLSLWSELRCTLMKVSSSRNLTSTPVVLILHGVVAIHG